MRVIPRDDIIGPSEGSVRYSRIAQYLHVARRSAKHLNDIAGFVYVQIYAGRALAFFLNAAPYPAPALADVPHRTRKTGSSNAISATINYDSLL